MSKNGDGLVRLLGWSIDDFDHALLRAPTDALTEAKAILSSPESTGDKHKDQLAAYGAAAITHELELRANLGTLERPSPASCSTNADVQWTDDAGRPRRGFAIWYPQMGGHVGAAVVEPLDHVKCIDVYVWHDGQIGFGPGGARPTLLHHCDAWQFVDFGQQVLARTGRGQDVLTKQAREMMQVDGVWVVRELSDLFRAEVTAHGSTIEEAVSTLMRQIASLPKK